MTSANSSPALSVIIPTYNRAGYVRTCLEALRECGVSDLEIIVSDDGSTDDTKDVVAAVVLLTVLAACWAPSGRATEANPLDVPDMSSPRNTMTDFLATTDQFVIVADGRLQPFDGDLEDYREWLLKSKLAASPEKSEKQEKPEKPKPVEKRSVSKPADRKPIESRIKRLEEQMAKLNSKKAAIDAQLADPAVYQDRKKIEPILLDQAYVAKELSQLEGEWLEKQAELERAAEKS